MKDFPMIRSVKAGVIGALVVALPLPLLSFSPLTGLYAALLGLFVWPMALCVAGLVCGAAPMALGAAAGVIAFYRLYGAQGALLSAVYAGLVLLTFAAVIRLRVPFFKACAAEILAHLAALCVIYLLLQRRAGGELYAAAGEAAADALKSWELGDALLLQMYQTGLIDLPAALSENMVRPALGGYALSAPARADMLLSVRGLVSSALSTLAPGLMVSQSILGGVLCLLLPLRFGFLAAERRAFRAEGAPETAQGKPDFPDLGMPPFSLWHLPRGIGWQVGAALAAGWALERLGSAPATVLAGTILYAAASAVFILQGAALLNFMQKSRGARRFWRVLAPLLLQALGLLLYIGIFDQIVNIRGLRQPRKPKEEE